MCGIDFFYFGLVFEKKNSDLVLNEFGSVQFEQELSYRKQTTLQLPTQYVEGIYSNPVT